MYSFEQICERFPDIENILFIAKSDEDPSRKTYLLNNIIIKSRKIDDDKTAHLRENNLKEEYEILKKCEVLKGIPQALFYFKNEFYELLFQSYLPGIQIYELKISLKELFKISFKLSNILIKLSALGICHNDITPRNVLIENGNVVSLIDFDQAIKTKPHIAFARQLLGLNIGESKVNHSIITIFKDYLRKKFPRTIFGIKKLLGKKYLDVDKLPALEKGADPILASLLRAWQIAQSSNASSPGLPKAYYAIDFEGNHFPGERPWSERWNRLKSISDYKGKTILELGCNMGLLSIHLLKETGAAKCIGVDHDKKILESAKLISKVFEVNPVFNQVNFDAAKDWESDLLSYKIDIVFALNVLNWVNDKERLLKFLSNFPEIIFEGHDTAEVERKRFEQIGFNKIEEIGYSERERIILRCRK